MNLTETQDVTAAAPLTAAPLAAVQCDRLRVLLRSALARLDAQGGDLEGLGESLRAALDHVRAAEMTAALGRGRASADGDATAIGADDANATGADDGDADAPEADDAGRDAAAPTVLAARPAEPVGEWLLIPFGQVRVDRPLAGRDFAFTPQHAASACRWFERLGRKLAIDYEHQSLEALNTRPDGLRPAAGWIGGLAVRDDGLWAVDVTWTDKARTLLASGEYRYFSPVIYWTDAAGSDVAALGPVALTNDPAMCGVPALAARREAAGDAHDEGPDGTLDDEVEAFLSVADDLQAARAELTTLRRQLALQAAEAFIERGLRLGKIVESTSKDWRGDYLRNAAEAEARLARAPIVLPPGRIVTRGLGEPTSSEDRAPGSLAGARALVEAEDLHAYERAARAGRVRAAGR